MVQQSNRNPLLFTVTAVLISSALYFYSTGLNGFGILLFIAPIPILILANHVSVRMAFTASVIAYAVGGLNMVGYLNMLVPVPLTIIFILVPSIAFAFSVISSRAATLRARPWLAVFAFPAAWTSYEYLLSLASPNGTAGSIAYTQTDYLPLIQVSSLTGIWGITFMVTLIPAAVAVLWHVRDFPKKMFQVVAVPAILILFVIIFGFISLERPESNQSIPVGLAESDTSVQHFGSAEIQEALPVVRAYAQRAAELAEKGAQIVLLPEKFVGITSRYDTTVYSVFKETSRAGKAIIIAGFNHIESPLSLNEAVVFLPLEMTLHYEKRYFVPGIELNYLRGRTPLVFQYDGVNIGVEICKDMDFPSWSREYGKRDVKVLFVPAWDFSVDGRFHSRMAVMRGVENGFSIVRCTQQGLLTVSDCKGKVIAEKVSGPDAILQSSISPGIGETFYSAAGDWFAWLNVLFVAVFIPWLLWHIGRKMD